MMYKIIRSSRNMLNVIRIEMILEPVFYEDSPVFGGIVPKGKNQYTTDVNPSRIINGPLSDKHQELEPPIQDEYDEFLEDCRWLIEHAGFTIISQHRSEDSGKSEYFIVFGMNDKPCGQLVFDLRISDHLLDSMTFPEEEKAKVREYLNVNNVLNGEATKAGIDFIVRKVTVGSVKNDTWARAFNRLGHVLDAMRVRVRRASRQ